MPSFDAQTARVGIRRPTNSDCDEYVALMLASEEFHRPWGDFPKTRERFYAYVRSRQAPNDDGFLICDVPTGTIVGVVNLNVIVRNLFQSAYLGYAIGAPFAQQGYMTDGLRLVIHYAFTEMGLHRLEANIQPQNTASIALVKKVGFRKEGYSPKYLFINNEWRDHERWAILADEFEPPGEKE